MNYERKFWMKEDKRILYLINLKMKVSLII